MVDWWTVGVSLGASLVASYIGVRFFTGPRLRAERAVLTRVAIRDVVSPMRRDLRGFRAHMSDSLRRSGTAHPDDAETATTLMRLAHDLPPVSRRSMRRRIAVVFGSGWTRVAELRDSTVAADQGVSASYATAVFLMDSKRGSIRRSYVDGLLHRAYMEGPNSAEAKRLDRQLMLLSEGR